MTSSRQGAFIIKGHHYKGARNMCSAEILKLTPISTNPRISTAANAEGNFQCDVDVNQFAEKIALMYLCHHMTHSFHAAVKPKHRPKSTRGSPRSDCLLCHVYVLIYINFIQYLSTNLHTKQTYSYWIERRNETC